MLKLLLMSFSRELIEELELLRPVCPRWSTKKGCKHSQSCKVKHVGRDGGPDPRKLDAADLPHTSRHVLLDGSELIVARPPLNDAWQVFFDSIGTA